MLLSAALRAGLSCSRWGALNRAFSSSAASLIADGAQNVDKPREKMQYDVLIVGAGPAGLSAAIKIKQLCKEKGKELSVCVIEKGAEVGAHILSGNVLEVRALDELLPDWKKMEGCPVKVAASQDYFYALPSATSSIKLPNPKQMHNKGNYVVSLSEVVRWLGKHAEDLGVDIFPGFAGREVLYNWDGAVEGVATGDMGVGKDGRPRTTFQRGVELRARATLFSEGCRGSLAESVIARFKLRAKAGAEPQTYGLGLKEVWEVPASQHKPGLVVHTIGYPLDHSTYGGGFIYHMDNNRVALGLVIGLDYSNPHLNTFKEFQRWKLHHQVRKHIEGGTCLQYGARALNEGGFQSIPQLHFPGGALLGCSAGFLNVPKIKGTHTAMKSGMVGGEAAFRLLTGEGAEKQEKGPLNLSLYQEALQRSWVWEELRRVRNIRPGFRAGLLPGLANAALDTYVLRGGAPWTLRHRSPDNEALKPISTPGLSAPDYPKPDGKITFDLPTSLYRSGTNHDHDQPPHLKVVDAGVPERLNRPHYAGPETKYCPAGVYEYQSDQYGREKLHINAQNCLHCKACDIKDMQQNIKWTVPEGGGGPNYTVM
mmetsp:Transcript_26826/g.58500  ORF Transcript_26826/g.58500 Transcript_26826/m.58500 type:complete len:596 (-) Transcript_26826:208-1995(-)